MKLEVEITYSYLIELEVEMKLGEDHVELDENLMEKT